MSIPFDKIPKTVLTCPDIARMEHQEQTEHCPMCGSAGPHRLDLIGGGIALEYSCICGYNWLVVTKPEPALTPEAARELEEHLAPVPTEERCPKCGSVEFDIGKPLQDGPTLRIAPSPDSRRCACGAAWNADGLPLWSEAALDPTPPEPDDKPTLHYTGAAPDIERHTQGLRIYAKPSRAESRGIPGVCVFLFPSGRVGAVTEKACTPAMRAAFDDALSQIGQVFGEREGNGKTCGDLHGLLVTWLRREWKIGRVRRLVTGEWDFVTPAVEA